MIVANNAGLQTPQFRVLTDGQCQELYQACLECLDRIGVQANNPDARPRSPARKSGCRLYWTASRTTAEL